MILAAWIGAMLAIGVYAYQRGWRQISPWLRRYVWCAVAVEAIMFLPLLIGYFPAGPLVYPFIGLMYANLILIWSGIAIGAALLVRMLLTGLLRAS